MKTELTDNMPERENWAWLREMLDALGDKVLKLYCLDVAEVKKTRAACHNWSYRYSEKKVVTSTTRENGGYTLFVRTEEKDGSS